MNRQQLKNFNVVNDFSKGYRNKTDVTVEEPGVAVSGSQNCQIIDNTKLGVRPGFSYLGSRSTDRYGIVGGGSWKTSTDTEVPIRSYSNGSNGIVEVYVGSAWETLIDTMATQGARFLNKGAGVLNGWWSATEVLDLLLFVDGSSSIFMWSGGTTTFASATSNTLTKQGTTTWGEERFLANGTRKVRIKDDSGTWQTFTYTGGEGTTTLTGVSPDPTVLSLSSGAQVLQEVRETTNKPSSGNSNDFLVKYLNYLFVFDRQRNTVEMSKNSDYTDFSSPSSPRVAGEAASFNLDETPTGAISQPDGDALYITTRNQWYQFLFSESSDKTKEVITIKPLKTSALEGATNELAVVNMKNYTVYTSGEPTIDNLGRVQEIDTPRSVPLSDPIKNYIDIANVENSTSAYYKNNFYTALSSDSDISTNNRILVRNLQVGAWETPWTIPASIIFEYNGELYAHDSATKNTYALLDSNFSDNYVDNDTQAPISAKWYSSHFHYGYPCNQKSFSIMWIDGYITAGTELDIIFNYDFSKYSLKRTLSGLDDNVVITQTGGGLGYCSLGSRNLGGRGETLEETGLRRFRGFIPVPERKFYELQVSFQSNGIGYRWKIVSYGLNIRVDSSQDNNLKISI